MANVIAEVITWLLKRTWDVISFILKRVWDLICLCLGLAGVLPPWRWFAVGEMLDVGKHYENDEWPTEWHGNCFSHFCVGIFSCITIALTSLCVAAPFRVNTLRALLWHRKPWVSTDFGAESNFYSALYSYVILPSLLDVLLAPFVVLNFVMPTRAYLALRRLIHVVCDP
jgi:hypothetical protein